MTTPGTPCFSRGGPAQLAPLGAEGGSCATGSHRRGESGLRLTPPTHPPARTGGHAHMPTLERRFLGMPSSHACRNTARLHHACIYHVQTCRLS